MAPLEQLSQPLLATWSVMHDNKLSQCCNFYTLPVFIMYPFSGDCRNFVQFGENQNEVATGLWKNLEDTCMFSHFDTLPECYRQTAGRRNGIALPAIIQN